MHHGHTSVWPSRSANELPAMAVVVGLKTGMATTLPPACITIRAISAVVSDALSQVDTRTSTTMVLVSVLRYQETITRSCFLLAPDQRL